MFNALNLMGPATLAISSETLEMLWQTPLLGMVMIFAVLTILWTVLALFKFIFAKPIKEKKPEPVAEKTVEAAVEIDEEIVAGKTDDGELIAVITAAVAAYMASEEPNVATNGFRVVSFRRVNGGKPWNTK